MTDGADVVEHHRYVIVGAGPAGLQLSYYLKRAGADYLTLERETGPGRFFARYPRHRRLISLNKVHNTSDDPEIRLRWDWNSLLNDDPELQFPKFSDEYLPGADVLVKYLEAFQRGHELNVRYGCSVERIERHGSGFRVRTDDGEVTADCVIVAAGWGRPFVPRIDGIEHATGYEDMEVDPDHYAGQRVLIIGKGNSAFEAATPIIGKAAMVHLASRRPLRLAWNSKHPGDVRGQFGVLLDSYQFKTLHSVLDCEIERIRPTDRGTFEVLIRYTHADDERELLEYESVIRCTGFRMDTDAFAEDCTPELTRDGRLPALDPDWQATGVDGLYFAGTLAQDRDFKHASSPFIDGFRYNLRTLTELLRERYDGVPLAFGTLPADAIRMTDLVLDRLNWSSALWTQFEYLCDVLVVERDGRVRHYQDLPEDYAVERFADEPHVYTANLRWGREEYADIFAIQRHPQPDRASESAFIHPVISRWNHGEKVAEKHLLEDLLAHWRRPDRHIGPLQEFFKKQLDR